LLSAPPEQLASALQPLAACAGRVLPIARLTREGARQAAYGRRLTAADFEAHPPDGTCAWLAPSGKLAAIGTAAPGNEYVVDRGFAYDTSSSAS
jgi:hypothetical protein